MKPLLELDDARVDVGGAPLMDGVSVAVQDGPIALLGAWHPLLSLFAGRGAVRRGRVHVRGVGVETRLRDGSLGVALRAPPSVAFDVSGLLTASALLAGHGRREAKAAGARTLAKLELDAFRDRTVPSLSAAEGRAISIARAIVAEPAFVAFEAPLAGLDDAWARWILALLDRAVEGREWLAFLGDAPGGERVVADRCVEALSVRGGCVTARGTPADLLRPGSRWLVTLAERASDFAAALETHGHRASLAGGDATGVGAARLVVELARGESATTLLEIAEATDVALVELVPSDPTA